MSTKSARKGVKGCNPLVGRPAADRSKRPPSAQTQDESAHPRSCNQQPPLSSNAPAERRRGPCGASIRSRPPRQRDAAARVGPALLATGAASLDTAKRRGVDRWRAANHTARTAAPTSRRWGRRHLRRRYAARAGGAVLVLPQGPAGQRSARLHSLHAAARVEALRAAYGPLQRRTGRARVDLLRLGAPGLRPPP